MFEGRAAISYDHGSGGEVFYLGLALDPAYIEGFVEGRLKWIGEDDPDGEMFLRDLWEEGETESVLIILQADCEILSGRPEDYLPCEPKAEHLFRSLTKIQESHPTNQG